jgi:phosphoglycolate phosphatase-like HAD superfamily hydrolase
MSVAHEEDYRRRVAEVGPTRFLPGTSVEVVREVRLTAPPRFALFDFDGTLSLVREGWPDVMIPMMVEHLAATGTSETRDQLSTLARNFVMELNGKQTIYQMIRLADEIRSRGGSPRDPLDYKQQYHDRLMERIADRRRALESRAIKPEVLLVPGTYAALGLLRERGLELYLASGTDENYVREEADLLGLTPFFGRHIYGAIDDHRKFSKQMVIERILRENQVEGSKLIGLGDGYVEIDNIKGAGGTAIAVASDEAGRSGKPDPWKRDRLIGVGADLVIPDFREFAAVCEYLWRGFA